MTHAFLHTLRSLLVPDAPLTHPLLCHPIFTQESLTLFKSLVQDARAIADYEVLVTCIASLYVQAPELDALQPQLLNCTHLSSLASSIISRTRPLTPPPSIPPERTRKGLAVFDQDVWKSASLRVLRWSIEGVWGQMAWSEARCQVAFFRVWAHLLPCRLTRYGILHALGVSKGALEAEEERENIWSDLETLQGEGWEERLHPRALLCLRTAQAQAMGARASFAERLRAQLDGHP